MILLNFGLDYRVKLHQGRDDKVGLSHQLLMPCAISRQRAVAIGAWKYFLP